MSLEPIAIDPWLQPLADAASGPDLEYDPAFLALVQAAQGRPETQFGPAEAPVWSSVFELAQPLLERSRDLRVAILWCRAAVHLHGLEGLAQALALLHGLLEGFWDDLHPQPDADDADALARLSVLASLNARDGLLGDARKALLIADRRLGALHVRDVEIALERLAPRADESTPSRHQIETLLSELPDLCARLREATAQALQGLSALQQVMEQRFGAENAIELKALHGMLSDVQSLLPALPEAADAADGQAPGEAGARRGGGGVHSIDSRQEAVRAIDLICAYLERHEPSSPAQLLLRRAARLIDKNFMQLMRELAPAAVNEVARILGVAPDALEDADAG